MARQHVIGSFQASYVAFRGNLPGESCGVKPLASGYLAKAVAVIPTDSLHYVLKLTTSSVVTGCDTVEILEQAIQLQKQLSR